MLDEPTNHLDISSRTVLEEALREYEGTLLMVSHDRYLLDRTVGKLIVLRDGEVRLFNGNFTRYAEALRCEEAQRREEAARQRQTDRRRAKPRAGDKRKKPARRHTYDELERKIIDKEEEIRRIHTELAGEATYRDPERVKTLKSELVRSESELRELEGEWETWVE